RQTSTITIPRDLLSEKEGIVLLRKKTYDQLLSKLFKQEMALKRLKEEIKVNKIIAQGEKELKQGKTIIASSSKSALKKYLCQKR
ncbi:hypothetical protein J7J41_00135, partial [bacterium]|nr:hypothetical protein [bacterium]